MHAVLSCVLSCAATRRMDEYMFWLIYFTLCKRYLPQQQHQTEDPETAAVAAAGAAAAAAAAAGGGAAAAAATSDSRADSPGSGQPGASAADVSLQPAAAGGCMGLK